MDERGKAPRTGSLRIFRRKLVTCAVLLLAGCSDSRQPERILTGKAMGTVWTVRIVSAISEEEVTEVDREIGIRLEALEQVFSTWRPDSEISGFNQLRTTEAVPVSPRLATVLAEALEIARQSGGALDPTLGPLVDLWSFGANRRNVKKAPSDEEINAAMRRCGWRKLEVTINPPTLRKTVEDLEVNPSAVVEGFAVGEMGRLLSTLGIKNWLIDLGGEMKARGRAADGSPWRVGIQAPDAAPGEIFTTVELDDLSLATSGTYRQRFEDGGREYSHLIDPRTGRPIENGLASVTVLHSRCLTADGWATALMVLGRERGEPLARSLDLKVIWIERE